MNRRPPEPLSAEERQLADQLARLGPHGEPSPTLDARILAAAHDAVAARAAAPRKPRWPVAMGLAASALLAVGIAWQLRPVDEVPSAEQTALPEARLVIADEPQAADAAAAAPADAPPASARQVAPPAPASVVQPPTVAKPMAMPHRGPAERVATREATPPARRQAPAPQAAAEPASVPAVEYGRPLAAPPAPPPPVAATARADATTLDSVAMPPASVQSYGNASGADRPGFVADPETAAAIAASREKARAEQARDAADAAEAARGGAEARARRGLSAPKATPQPAPPPPAITTSAPVAPAPASATRNALKRTDLQLPVIEDTKLPPEDWLERIRLRRDLGDRASATDSLVRFKQNHPFQKVPDDLKELLGE
ncbi:hypothetical protein M8R20_30970 [Pseudomonas sp. R2.Fl]|nr:hypothetical protein [Pseudomonas sp. R2.Fl]